MATIKVKNGNAWEVVPIATSEVDYVVEQGTQTLDGMTWTYTKWNSGKAECIGSYAFTTGLNAWGSIYSADLTPNKTFPLTFISSPYMFAESSNSDAAFFVIRICASTTQLTRLSIARVDGVTRDFQAVIKAIGRWK